jgi:CRISPR-associated protein Csd2
MSNFTNKVDFAVIITVTKANPNGDPLNGNRPREDFNGYGEISDVCIKRKIRNRLQDKREKIFVQSEDRAEDKYHSLQERAENNENLKNAIKNNDRKEFREKACEEWIDVRSFGQLFAFKNKNKSKNKNKNNNSDEDQSESKDVEKSNSISVGVRGPVSIQVAQSVSPIDITSMQITKSVNGEPTEDGSRSPDTMGMKNRVEFGTYVIRGSINPQLAKLTGFSEEDAEKIKYALTTLFENDASSARPDGSMEVRKVYWWKHNCPSGQYSSAEVQRSLVIKLKEGVEVPKSFDDYEIKVTPLEGLEPEVLEGR